MRDPPLLQVKFILVQRSLRTPEVSPTLSKQGEKWNNLVHNPNFQALQKAPSKCEADTKQQHKNLGFNMNILLIEVFSSFSNFPESSLWGSPSDAILLILLNKQIEAFIS